MTIKFKMTVTAITGDEHEGFRIWGKHEDSRIFVKDQECRFIKRGKEIGRITIRERAKLSPPSQTHCLLLCEKGVSLVLTCSKESFEAAINANQVVLEQL